MTVYCDFTVNIRVVDAVALVAAARLRAVQDGSPLADGDEISITEAIQWLLDPGVSPPGCEIQDSQCEETTIRDNPV